MFIDHFAASLLGSGVISIELPFISGAELYTALRSFGRFSFPMYCFFIVEGYKYTKDLKKYMSRLLVFGIISEIPFDMAISGKILESSHQNVFFTLLLGLILITVLDKYPLPDINSFSLRFVTMAVCMGLAYFGKTDYEYIGIAIIVLMYSARNYRIIQAFIGAAFMIYEYQNVYIILPAALFFIMIMLYNGQREPSPLLQGGRFSLLQKERFIKYFFYMFYPVHLLVLGIMRLGF
ncbi:MAG: conjugal transfer protein TraX [Eubacterium sp.]|nr:conjugal transfer protein TraX [Eubacterium sp.]